MKSRGVRRHLVASTLPCKLLQAAFLPCFGFTVSQPKSNEIHRNPWVTSRSARIVSKSWVNPMGHDASRAVWEGITNWFRHVSSTSSSLSSHSRPKNAKHIASFCQFLPFLFRIFKTADCHCTSMIAFAQFRLPLSIAQYLNGPVLSLSIGTCPHFPTGSPLCTGQEHMRFRRASGVCYWSNPC